MLKHLLILQLTALYLEIHSILVSFAVEILPILIYEGFVENLDSSRHFVLYIQVVRSVGGFRFYQIDCLYQYPSNMCAVEFRSNDCANVKY